MSTRSTDIRRSSNPEVLWFNHYRNRTTGKRFTPPRPLESRLMSDMIAKAAEEYGWQRLYVIKVTLKPT